MSSTKWVYLLRHAEKDPNGSLTERGRSQAKILRDKLPQFQEIISSDSPRTIETTELITGRKPIVDPRCRHYVAPKAKSDFLNTLAKEKGISFLEAVVELNDEEVNQGVEKKAVELNQLVDELLRRTSDGQNSLVVSHDLSISPALAKRGIPLESIDYLCGYIINDSGKIQKFTP